MKSLIWSARFCIAWRIGSGDLYIICGLQLWSVTEPYSLGVRVYYAYKTLNFAFEILMRRPVLIVDRHGIYDRRAIGKVALPWSVIAKVSVVPRPKNLIIVVDGSKQRDAGETLFSRVTNYGRRKLNNKAPAFLMTPVLCLEGDFNRLLDSIRQQNINMTLRFEGFPSSQ